MLISQEIKDKILQCNPCYFINAFPKIFSWAELESLLNLRPFVNNKRFKVINDRQYQWGLEGWLSDSNTYPPTLLEEELKKYVCYFSDSSRVNAAVNNICKELEELFFNSCCDAHIYFTVANTMKGGFGGEPGKIQGGGCQSGAIRGEGDFPARQDLCGGGRAGADE